MNQRYEDFNFRFSFSLFLAPSMKRCVYGVMKVGKFKGRKTLSTYLVYVVARKRAPLKLHRVVRQRLARLC